MKTCLSKIRLDVEGGTAPIEIAVDGYYFLRWIEAISTKP